MRVTTAPSSPGATTVSGGRALVLGLCSLLAAGAIMMLSLGVGEVLAGIAVLGLLFVIIVLINPFLGVVALLGTLLLGLPGWLLGSGRLTANNALGLILALALIVQLSRRRDIWFLRAPQIVLLLLIGTMFVVSLVHSWHAYVPVGKVPRDMTGNTLFLFFSRLAFLVFIVNFLNTERRVIAILWCMLGFTMVVIPSAFYNLVTWTGATDVVTGKPLEEFRISADVTSWGQNANRLAFMCNISILLIWMFGQIWKARLIRTGGLVAILALTALVLGTGSRSGFLSLGLVSAILLFQRGLPRLSRFGIVGALLACAVGVLLLLPPDARERLLNYSADQSARQEGWRSTIVRIETDEHALEVIEDAPLLGVGPGNFRWIHHERYPYSMAAGRPTHNSFLWAATEGGVLVLALYLGLFFVIWRDLRAALRHYSPDHQLWHVAWFLGGYLIVFLFFSLFADFWLEPHLYLLAGLSILLRRFATAVGSDRLPSAGAALARA